MCSLYSQYGFCGVTDEFCGDGCQPNSDGSGCGAAPRPKDCTTNTDALSYERRIGYYELFATQHDCNVFEPEDIVVAGLTHLNLAFVNFGDDFKLQTGDGSLIYRSSLLKVNNPGLHVCISVGGWDFNNPPDQTLWSDMANDYTNRQTFISSVVDFLKKYGLDGIDLDWEYPSASDRGGIPSDADAFVLLVSDLRDAFDSENPGWTISATLPTSYWYLRGFNVESMQKYVSWFNLMSYDLHGTWDHDNKWTGPYLKGHTDITEIDLGLDLLWRNGVDPAKVVFGMGFYGRSFTMADPNCYEPNGVCEFTTGGRAGTCSDTVGILTYQEIAARNSSYPEHVCIPSPCGKNKIQIGTALDPPPSPALDSTFPFSCDGVVAPPGRDMHYPLCCDLQSKYNKKWPVDPEKVFQTYYNNPGDSDVMWQYSDEYTNNDKDDGQSNSEDGTDAYGFLMLDGPEGSIDSSFSTTNTIVRKEAAIPRVKRSLVTYNQTVMDTVFDHTEETFQIYCNFPVGSAECNRLWIDGAEDTIIRMPDM
ncbi:Killer toxin subunits alpha/beta [Daldinia childiae]|uniref:Killer toxin subunits alpha/beta n=1 Tax=Daldinia childiae TaxID=326645 RepID=UPI001447977F|nr:Killer toxin subunits alpha/beta [Daldinia childiae]KAF3058356.1 Killer toxin subunits alpha/beta [Daldinia childiae]